MIKRGRGRPRKEAGAGDSSVSGEGSTISRGRGRPRKEAGAGDSSVSVSVSVSGEGSTISRGRGRPRKDAKADESAMAGAAASLISNLSLNGESDLGDEGGRPEYLTPLQLSLVHELTIRRQRIAKAQERIDFWREHDRIRQEEQDPSSMTQAGIPRRDRFGADVVDDAFLDDLIRQRKERLRELQQSQRLKEAIVESADAAHAINASMAVIPPASFAPPDHQTPLCIHSHIAPVKQPLRSLVARRDQLAFQFLHLDSQIKQSRTKRRGNAREIDETREKTSKMLKAVRAEKQALSAKREADESASIAREGDESAQRRIRLLAEALQTARSKREMVKGVLRGLILESGMDWFQNAEMRTLMLSLGDDDMNSSDEEVNLFSEDDAEEEEDDEHTIGE